MLTILCIDDEPHTLTLREALLKAEGFQVLSAADANTAIELASQNQVDAVVLDYSMSPLDGLHVARLLRQQHPKLPIILYSGCLDIPKEAFALVDGFVAKGNGSMFLVWMIRSVLSRKKPPRRERRWDKAG
jgi:CheY-like chemotaxis protein